MGWAGLGWAGLFGLRLICLACFWGGFGSGPGLGPLAVPFCCLFFSRKFFQLETEIFRDCY